MGDKDRATQKASLESMVLDKKYNDSGSGLISKTHWLAFIDKNRLKLNDSINSLGLDLIDAKNILAQIK